MNTPSFVQFIGLPNKLLFTAKTDKRAVGLRAFALSKKANGFVPEQDIAIKRVDLDISRLYSRNHMVGMDKISSNENSTQNLLLEEMVCNHYTTCLYFVNMHNFFNT
jgi:hypothetical protein